MNNMSCHCCKKTGLTERNYFRDYKHLVCDICGYENFVKQKERDISSFYENDPDYSNDIHTYKDFNSLIMWNHKNAINFLKNKKNANSGNLKVLDIGCFNGFFVKKLITLGFDAYGVDFNKNAILYGQQNYDLEKQISSKNINQLLDKGIKYDVIMLFEVIEHLEGSPTDFIENALKLLNKKGNIIISVPNKNMLWRPELDFPPHHLSRFTPRALDNCVNNAGAEKIFAKEQMSLFDLIRNFVGAKFFRTKSDNSLRGGTFKNKQLSNQIKIILNKSKSFFYIILRPIDFLLYYLGFRYIGQIYIGVKKLK